MLGSHHSFSEQFCCHHLPSHIPSFSKLHRHCGALLSSDGPIGPPVTVFRLVFLSETGQSDNHKIREWTPVLYMLSNLIKLRLIQVCSSKGLLADPQNCYVTLLWFLALFFQWQHNCRMTSLNFCKSNQKLVKSVASSRFLQGSAGFALARVSPVLEKHHLLWTVTHHKLQEKTQDYSKQQKKITYLMPQSF